MAIRGMWAAEAAAQANKHCCAEDSLMILRAKVAPTVAACRGALAANETAAERLSEIIKMLERAEQRCDTCEKFPVGAAIFVAALKYYYGDLHQQVFQRQGALEEALRAVLAVHSSDKLVPADVQERLAALQECVKQKEIAVSTRRYHKAFADARKAAPERVSVYISDESKEQLSFEVK